METHGNVKIILQRTLIRHVVEMIVNQQSQYGSKSRANAVYKQTTRRMKRGAKIFSGSGEKHRKDIERSRTDR